MAAEKKGILGESGGQSKVHGNDWYEEKAMKDLAYREQKTHFWKNRKSNYTDTVCPGYSGTQWINEGLDPIPQLPIQEKIYLAEISSVNFRGESWY